ncbi:MAG TPA: flagellar hook-associated protein 3, partial [Firmicutes bacterium]|nr:flagellar hook-associated protein 3 [Bacillota bacterium]
MPKMRITHNIMIANFLRNLNAISNRLEVSQKQLATGLKYNKPSDGPIEVGQGIGFQSTIARFNQYMKNVDDGTSQVSYIDTIVQSVIDDLGRSRDLALDAANDNMNLADRRTIAQEINQIIRSTLSNANTKFRDRYSFAGWNTLTMPFEAIYNPRTGFVEDVIYYGNRGKIDRLVGDADQLTINVSGKSLFLEQTYTRIGRVLPGRVPLGFDGTIRVNGVSFRITPDMTLQSIALKIDSMNKQTHVFAYVDQGRLILESATALSEFTITDDQNGKLLENLGLFVSGAFNVGISPPTLPIVDSTPAIFTGAGPVANLTYDETNNTMNIFLGADANYGISKAANIFITPGTYASVDDLIVELQKQIDAAFGSNRLIVSDAGGGVLQIETVATGDEVDAGDLVIGGPFNGLPDTASDSADLNLIAVVGNAPATFAGTAGTDGNDKIIIDLGPSASKSGLDVPPQTIDLRAGMITT